LHLVRDPLPEARSRASLKLKVIGIGNAYRGDDAVGLAVARALRADAPAGVDVLELEGEPTSLLGAWEGCDVVWLVDAVSSGSPPGTVHRVDACAGPVPAAFGRTSTHHLGLPEAVELARALARLPARLVVFGVEAESYGAGEGLTPAVEAAVEPVADAIRAEIAAGLA
jgi:hydrogenase maturation protease